MKVGLCQKADPKDKNSGKQVNLTSMGMRERCRKRIFGSSSFDHSSFGHIWCAHTWKETN